MIHTLAPKIALAVEAIKTRAPKAAPRVGVILGTGLGALAKCVEAPIEIPYGDLPHFVKSTVQSHAGRLMLGTISGVEVALLDGRFHYYEGYSLEQVTFGVRVLKALGAKTLIVTNVSGGLNPDYKIGDIMAISDHISLPGMCGANPLTGHNDESLGPRFPDMFEPYKRSLLERSHAAAKKLGIELREGVYIWVSGPNLETRAEYRMLRLLGADVVGMSTVPEVIAAVHAGMDVAGFSIVSDMGTPELVKPVNLEEIIRVANETEPKLASLVRELIAGL